MVGPEQYGWRIIEPGDLYVTLERDGPITSIDVTQLQRIGLKLIYIGPETPTRIIVKKILN